jgi:XTP/dITP diphosphohydrolase
VPCVDKIVIASSNPHKIDEMQFFLKEYKIEACNLSEFAKIPAPDETGKTFIENAELKARYYADKLKLPVLADDSGLVVKSLKGEPGVRSARFAGENASGVENNKLLLEKLNGHSDRSAFFQCVLSLILPKEKRIVFFVGKCDGKIITEYKGESGFGYDPIFKPDGQDKTFAKMNAKDKNAISHRGIAFRGFDKFLRSTF